MGYSIDSTSNACYPGTLVLINKLGIRDGQELDELETAITTVRASEWLSAPKNNSFDFEHYKDIHRYLFGDLYSWAGELREIDISKAGTNFCSFAEIEQTASAVFARLKRLNDFTGLSKNDFVERLVDFYCVTNYLHPFREGNGRTQRTFITQLSRNAGYSIDFSLADKDELMIATIQSAQGVKDGLIKVFNNII